MITQIFEPIHLSMSSVRQAWSTIEESRWLNGGRTQWEDLRSHSFSECYVCCVCSRTRFEKRDYDKGMDLNKVQCKQEFAKSQRLTRKLKVRSRCNHTLTLIASRPHWFISDSVEKRVKSSSGVMHLLLRAKGIVLNSVSQNRQQKMQIKIQVIEYVLFLLIPSVQKRRRKREVAMNTE